MSAQCQCAPPYRLCPEAARLWEIAADAYHAYTLAYRRVVAARRRSTLDYRAAEAEYALRRSWEDAKALYEAHIEAAAEVNATSPTEMLL